MSLTTECGTAFQSESPRWLLTPVEGTEGGGPGVLTPSKWRSLFMTLGDLPSKFSWQRGC